MTRFTSLRARLLLLLSLAILPAVGLILYTGMEQRRHAALDAQRNALHLVHLASSNQERLIADARHLLTGLAQLPAVRNLDPIACNALLAGVLRQYRRYVNFGALKPDGEIFCSAVPLDRPLNIGDRPAIRSAIKTGQFTVGAYQMGLIVHRPILPLTYPSVDPAGRVRIAMFATLDLGWLNQFAAEVNLPAGSTLTMIDRNGTILVRHPNPEAWVGKPVAETPLAKTILGQHVEGTTEAFGVDGIHRLYAFTPLGGAGPVPEAHLLIGIPSQVAFAEVNQALKRNLAGLGVVTILALGAAWLTSEMMVTRRVKGIATAAMRVQAGDLSARTSVPGGQDELSQLGQAFDQMAETLQQREADRRQAEEAMRRYTERLKILREIDRALLTTQSPEAIARAALSYIRELMGCVRVSITTVDLEAQEATVLAVHVSRETGLGPGARVPLELFGDMEEFRQGKVRLVEDLQTVSEDSPAVRALRADGVRAIASIPLVTQDALIGSLNLGWESVRGLGSEEMEVAREVANSLAVAMQQASLFRSISEHREQLRALAARLADVEEEERRGLARELHDKVGQNLSTLGINLNILRGQWAAGSAGKVGTRLDDSLRLVDETMQSIRDVMADLRPQLLDDYGLLAALRWYGEQVAGRTGLLVQICGEDLTPRLPLAVETTLFRIVQEALTNVAKHARAAQVTVTIEEADGEVRLGVADDGVGFDPFVLRHNRAHLGCGLISMRERAAAVGGRLRVDAAPGQGTWIRVDVRR